MRGADHPIGFSIGFDSVPAPMLRDPIAPYLALLRGRHGVAIEPGPDRLSAWLVRVHGRHRPIGADLRP
jgi:hypothetical protein